MKGKVSAPRPRIHLLMWVSAVICRKGTCTQQLLSSLVGCWIHVVLYRRPLLSLMDALFKESQGKPPTAVVCLSQHARHELISLILLGAYAQSDLRTSFTPKIFALDASPWGGGIVVADSQPEVVSELWRHSEQKGFYTNLLSPAGEMLKRVGIDPTQEELLCLSETERDLAADQPFRIPEALSEGILYDCVELFKGSGNWSTCHQQHGASCS